jgi:deoxyribodipyrimidine photo-lyase
MKHNKRLFHVSGIRNIKRNYCCNKELFKKWCFGQTGVDFVDALMRELLHTGFMSNRGRQNAASYLVHDLQINWMWGAAWFEHLLIDYDVYSNYGNWQYVAGVGNDPREGRKFNIKRQQETYDPDNLYINYWLRF